MLVGSVDPEFVPVDGDVATAQWPRLGQGDVGCVKTGDLGEYALRSAGHPPGPHVVLGPVPRADQAAVGVDAAVSEVRTQVPTSAADGEIVPVVADRVTSGSFDGAGRDVGDRKTGSAHGLLLVRSFSIVVIVSQPPSTRPSRAVRPELRSSPSAITWMSAGTDMVWDIPEENAENGSVAAIPTAGHVVGNPSPRACLSSGVP